MNYYMCYIKKIYQYLFLIPAIVIFIFGMQGLLKHSNFFIRVVSVIMLLASFFQLYLFILSTQRPLIAINENNVEIRINLLTELEIIKIETIKNIARDEKTFIFELYNGEIKKYTLNLNDEDYMQVVIEVKKQIYNVLKNQKPSSPHPRKR